MSVKKATTIMGQSVMIWIDGKVVALSTNCVVNYTTNMVAASSKDDGDNENQMPNTLGWTVTNDFNLTAPGGTRQTDHDFNALFDMWKEKKKVLVTIGTPEGWDGKSLEEMGAAWAESEMIGSVKSGYAYIQSMSETHQVGSISTGNISLQGAGPLSRPKSEDASGDEPVA